MAKRKNKFKETVLMNWERRRNLNSMIFLELDPEMMTEVTPRDNIDEIWRREAIFEVLSTLNERERSIIISLYLDDETLKLSSKRWKVSSQRIRQIEAKALRKLRHPERKKLLAPVLEGAEAREEKLLKEAKKEEERRKRKALKWKLGAKDREAKRLEEREARDSFEKDRRRSVLLEQEESDRQREIWDHKNRKRMEFHVKVQHMISIVGDEDVTLAPRLFEGKCKCRVWHAEYRFLCDEFEIGCMRCLTRFNMSVEEKTI